MNTVHLIGRLVRNPETRYPVSEEQTAVCHYTLAVNQYSKTHPSVAYIRCTAFAKNAEFAESYFYQGLKVAVSGRIATGSYKDKSGRTVYTTEVIVERQEFAESKAKAPDKARDASKWIQQKLPFV